MLIPWRVYIYMYKYFFVVGDGIFIESWANLIMTIHCPLVTPNGGECSKVTLIQV